MILPNGHAQLRYYFAGAGLPHGAQITMGLNVELWAGSADALAAACATAYGDSALGVHQCNSAGLQRTEVKFGPLDVGPTGVSGIAVPGVNGSDQAPPNVAALVKKNTGLGGRAGRGRLYFPAIPENEIGDAGVLDDTWYGLFVLKWEDFYNELIGLDVIPEVLHNAGSPIVVPSPIVTLMPDPVVATQRRRLRR